MNYLANVLLSMIVGALIMLALKYKMISSFYDIIHYIHGGIIFTSIVFLIIIAGTFSIITNIINTIILIIFVVICSIIVLIDILITILKRLCKLKQ